MAEFVERTFGALQTLLGSAGSSDSSVADAPFHQGKWTRSSNLRDFMHMIASSRSKFDEETIVMRELAVLKREISDPAIKRFQVKECLTKAMYCEMLGYATDFMYIHCVKLAQQGTLQEKMMGYLSASLFFHEQHEFAVLLVNTIHKDLTSSNALEVCLALRAACDFSGPETVDTILPIVKKLSEHPNDIVRKKVAVVLLNFFKKFPRVVSDFDSVAVVQSLLCDPDPGVMAAALQIYKHLVGLEPSKYHHLLPTCVEIQRQIIGHKLPDDYEYHGICAPWIQIQLIHIMTQVAATSSESSFVDQVAEVLVDTVEGAGVNHNAAFAIVYECMKSAVVLNANKKLLNCVLNLISKFLRSQNNNLKYAGLNILANVIQIVQPASAAEHQATMVECLYHPDEALRRKTLGLLFKMTNSSNIEVMCAKMLEYFATTDDDNLKADLVTHVLELTEQFSPDLFWSLQTIHTLYLKGAQWIQTESTFKYLEALRRGTGDADLDVETRQRVARLYFAQVRAPDLPEGLVQITAWILGEFSSEDGEVTPEAALDELVRMARTHWRSESILLWVLQAMLKVVLRAGITVGFSQFLTQHPVPKSPEMRQMLKELKLTAENLNAFQTNPYKSASEDELDFTLSFLDAYVADSLEAGAKLCKGSHSTVVFELMNNDK